MSQRQLPIILALGTTQTLAWASSYYLPALLADPMARDLGVSSNWIFGAFSASLVISAMLGPRIGRQIDLVGGRQVLSVSNLTIAAGLVLLGLSQSVAVMAIAWLVLGIGMATGLYDAAFAALGRIYGTEARRPITGITLMAGFASTVGWPLTAWGLSHFGWRETCFAWAAANILIGLPLNFFMLPAIKGARQAAATAEKSHLPLNRTMVLLAFVFAAVWTVTGAMAVHFPRLLEGNGRDACRGDRGRRADRPRTGGRAHSRSGFSQSLPSAVVDPARLPHPSARRGRSRHLRRSRSERVCTAPRLGQRHFDDRARHAAAVDLRPEGFWLSPRHHRRAGTDGAGRGAAGFRPAHRRHGHQGADRLLRAQPLGAGRAVHDPRATAAGLTGPELSRTSEA
ncbi:preprotein translocase subunit SecG [Bradyrhizobium sp. LM4.3]